MPGHAGGTREHQEPQRSKHERQRETRRHYAGYCPLVSRHGNRITRVDTATRFGPPNRSPGSGATCSTRTGRSMPIKVARTARHTNTAHGLSGSAGSMIESWREMQKSWRRSVQSQSQGTARYCGRCTKVCCWWRCRRFECLLCQSGRHLVPRAGVAPARLPWSWSAACQGLAGTPPNGRWRRPSNHEPCSGRAHSKATASADRF